MTTEHLCFPPFRVDFAQERLWRDTTVVPLRPKTFAVLRYLLEHAEHLVTNVELLTALWPGIVVSEAMPRLCIRELRRALGDDAKRPQFIETSPRRGYRFIATVTTPSQESREKDQDALFPFSPSSGPSSRIPIIVGRTTEIAQLHSWFDVARRDARQLVFVTGDPGIGKTAVVDLFLERIRTTSDVWIGRGQCLEQYGASEAYLPVIEALGQVCRGPGGKQALALLQRCAPTWVVQMPAFVTEVELEHLQRRVAGATQGRMLREMAEALEALTVERGLVLVVEDLHVSDRSTVDLLAYLAQRRERAKLMILGTYRPTEVKVQEHSLTGIKQALSAHDQCQELRLALLSPAAVGEYVAKRLGVETVPTDVTRWMYDRTDGNALFMVNVVEYCLQQQVLVQEEGQWLLKKTADQLRVPESVQQMIGKQLEGLGVRAQQVLEVASVAGSEFTVAAVAAAFPGTLDAIEDLCEELAEKSHLLREAGVTEWPDGTLSGRYAFRHVLYQNVLYERIAAARRVRVHRLIGERQEQGYGARSREIAAELVMHFAEGRVSQKAIQYLQYAGENAVRRSAHHEAISLLTKGLELLETLPDTPERLHQELSLQVVLGPAFIATKSYTAPEVEQAYARALALCRQIGESPHLFLVLRGLQVFYMSRAEYKTALELAEQLLRLAQGQQDSALLVGADLALGQTKYWLGEFSTARTILEQGSMLYDSQRHPFLTWPGGHPGMQCLLYTSWSSWFLGYPDQALRKSLEALALARQLSSPFNLATAMAFTVMCHQFRREGAEAQVLAEETEAYATTQGVPVWARMVAVLRGWALAEQGQSEQGIEQLIQSVAAWQATGTEQARSHQLALLAEAHLRAGQMQEGLTVVAEARALVSKNGEHHYEAELHRLQGELMLQQEWQRTESKEPKAKIRTHIQDRAFNSKEVEQEAEGWFLKAIAIAQRQQAKSWELRATMSLTRLWRQQGKKSEAHARLAKIYGWFTEGFGTQDLQDAQTLLGPTRG